MKYVSKIIVTIALCGCAGPVALGAGKDVNLAKADAPPGCKELGGVSGIGGYGDMVENAKNDVRNKAATKGANYVRWETTEKFPDGSGVAVNGTAYSCQTGANPAPSLAGTPGQQKM